MHMTESQPLRTQTTGLILAGGASRRMGRNKALIEWDGQPQIARVASALRPVTFEQLIIANDPEPYQFLHLPIIPDIEPGWGPLMGLYSGLRAAKGAWAILVAVDMPFLTSAFLQGLLAMAPGYDVVIPEVQDKLHPLCAVYRRDTCLPAIEAVIKQGQRRLIAFHDLVKVRRVDEATLRTISPDLRELININTPEELRQAQQLLKPPSSPSRRHES